MFDKVEFELVLEGWIRIGHMKMEGKRACENEDIKLSVRVS